MFGIMLSDAEIKSAPPTVRRWLEVEVSRTLGLSSAQGRLSGEDNSDPKQILPPRHCSKSTGDAKMGLMTEPATDEAIRELIAVRAYELWENQGRPHGYDVINWHQAEQDIMSCLDNRSAGRADKLDTDVSAQKTTPVSA